MPYPPIVLDRAASLPLYRQIEVALRRSILDGRIGPGARLPGIRCEAGDVHEPGDLARVGVDVRDDGAAV